MADIFRLSALSENTNLQTRYNNMLAGNLPANGVYESIQTVTVGAGGASSVSFTSIPQVYKHLQVRGIVRSNRGVSLDSLSARFNSDTGTNYAIHDLFGNGATASAQAQTSVNALYFANAVPTTAVAASIFSTLVVDILDYSNTNKYKTVRTLNGYDANGSGQVYLESGLWMNTAAVTQIDLGHFGTSSSMAQYSTFALYGIRG